MEKDTMKHAGLWLALFAAVAIVLFQLLEPALRTQTRVSPPGLAQSKVVLALPRQQAIANWFVGIDKGYFAEAGVDLVNQPHEIGLQALDSVLAGKADLAVVADTPVVFAVMNGANISLAVTSFNSRTYMALLARGDHGIRKAQDLRGKKIGFVPKTTAHFFLYSLLLANGLSGDKAQPTPITPAQIVPEIQTGALDAVASWEPRLSEATAAVGESAVVLRAPDIYSMRFSLVGRSTYISSHQAELKALILGLRQANQFISENPDEAREITQQHLPSVESNLVITLNHGDYQAVLHQGQLIALEDQARWALKEQLVPQQPLPNFLRHIDTTALLSIAPDDVTLVQ